MRFFVLAFLFLSGCGNITIRSEISVFHQFDESFGIKTYYFLPFDGQDNNLKYKTYSSYIRTLLKEHGLKSVDKSENPDLVIAFTYSDDRWTQYKSLPVFGVTGISQSTTYGTISIHGNHGNFSAITHHKPKYGVVGHKQISEVVKSQYLVLYIAKAEADSSDEYPVIYEASVNAGKNGATNYDLMPTMLVALFSDFPGKSGETRTETLLPRKIE